MIRFLSSLLLSGIMLIFPPPQSQPAVSTLLFNCDRKCEITLDSLSKGTGMGIIAAWYAMIPFLSFKSRMLSWVYPGVRSNLMFVFPVCLVWATVEFAGAGIGAGARAEAGARLVEAAILDQLRRKNRDRILPTFQSREYFYCGQVFSKFWPLLEDTHSRLSADETC